MLVKVSVMISLLLASMLVANQFVKQPVIREEAGKAIISFSVQSTIDCELAVLNSNGKVVRHLAAGVLGGDTLPPAPLVSGLSQSLEWDGLDDNGKYASGAPFSIRVRLGVVPEFEKRISTKVYGASRNAGLWFHKDTSRTVYPGNLGEDSIVSTDSIIPMTHPVWRQNKGHYKYTATWPDGTPKILLYEGGPKLDMTVSDVDDKIIMQSPQINGIGVSVALLDGISGNVSKIWSIVPSTMFLNYGMWYYGEPHFDWSGRYIFRDVGSLSNDIFRLTPEGLPAPFAASGTHVINQKVHYNSDFRQRGLTTDKDGNVYQGHDPATDETTLPAGTSGWNLISKFDSNGVLITDSLLKIYGNIGQGIRVDPQGNIFAGIRVKPYPDTVPREIRSKLEGETSDIYSQIYWAKNNYGSIVKFGPEGGKIMPNASGSLIAGDIYQRAEGTGIKWMRFGASFQPSHSSSLGVGCICLTPRFDVDRFGRVIFPNAFENEFKALDNNGNLIFRMRNRDFINKVKIGLIQNVQVTDRGIYCADYINNQIVCFTWKADAEAVLPLASVGTEKWVENSLGIIGVSPNPFNPSCALKFVTANSGHVNVTVYDSNGKKVKELVNGVKGKGAHSVLWNGTDKNGRNSAAGVYCFTVRTGKVSLTSKAMLVR
ncbi:MAG: T9SS type A sorting domain-containing protein [Fibrobacteres bacterium]|nr:T9SS type A sorting domain-containing protein [Fibrobacterota bacterium]